MEVFNTASTRIRVTAEILTARAGDAAQKISDMETRLGNIGRIMDSTRSYWIGEAGNACRLRYEREQAEIHEMLERLADLPRALLAVAGICREAEEEAKSASAPLPGNVIE